MILKSAPATRNELIDHLESNKTEPWTRSWARGEVHCLGRQRHLLLQCSDFGPVHTVWHRIYIWSVVFHGLGGCRIYLGFD